MQRALFRQRIFLALMAAVLPLAVMSAIALYVGYQQQRDQAERSGLDVARAYSIAVDAELNRTIAVLQVLDDGLTEGPVDLKAFHDKASRIRETQPGWRSIVLRDVSGRMMAETQSALGDEVPPVADRASFEAAIRSREPVVGHLRMGPKGWGVPVRVPVIRGTQVAYVLSAVLEPQAILDVLRSQRVPLEWVVAVADAKGLRVARTRSSQESLGTPYSPTLVEMMRKAGDEGKGVTYSSEGDAVFTAFTRSRATGWYTAVGLPTTVVDASARNTFNTWGGGLVLSLVLGVLAALAVARSVTRPMAQLRKSALAAQDGKAFVAPESTIREIHDVARTLEEASISRSELLESERRAREAAEKANRGKDEFLAMLGHELRNPLSAISNAATLLEARGLPAEHTAHARSVIVRQVGHLTRLTDDLLDVGRVLMGKIQLRREPLDLATLVAQSVATLKSAHRLRDHRLLEDYQSAWVDGDPVRIDQIVSNLVVNAAKYTPIGGTIRVRVAREGNSAVLCVADDGIGLAPELAPRVFDLFVQGERELDRSQGGLGIGLTLVRSLAQMHGGGATAASEGPGKGSEFTVRMPAIEASAVDAASTMRSETPPARHVLLVEDNADARETLRTLLESQGHRVDTAADGAAGLERALALQPEVILLDIGLPGMDGFEVAQRVRAAHGIRRPLLIAVTGYGSPEDRERALDAGFDAHLTKPLDYYALAALLSGAEQPAADSKAS